MAEKIYIMAEDGTLESMDETPFATEDVLQELIADHPELLAGEQMDPDNPRRWILITREKGISETIESARRWSIDHVFIDQDARPTLVEVKRGSNTEIRRTVVGQLLEYAAHATITWRVNNLRRTFEQSNRDDHTELLAQLLQEEESEEIRDSFWEKVETNLNARNLRLLFVADEIPDSLARIVEFLNAQMPDIEVLAVEIKQFGNESNQVLVPRLIGQPETQRSRTEGANLTLDQFLGQFEDSEVNEAASRLLNVARDNDDVVYVGTSGVSIRTKCSLYNDKLITVAWIYPPSSRGWAKLRDFSFGAGAGGKNLGDFGMEIPAELDSLLHQWCDQFKDDTFTEDVSSQGVVAHAISPDNAVKHIDLLEARLAKVLADLRAV